MQWVTTGYLLVLTSTMPLSALFKRRFRNKTLFLAAICCFIAGTMLCAAAPTFAALIAGRLVQGVGTGLALPLMFNIIIEQAPLEKMGLMMGIATLITAIAPAAGPSAGGFIASALGWRYIFIVLLPLLALSLAMGAFAIRQASETERVGFSFAQVACCCPAVRLVRRWRLWAVASWTRSARGVRCCSARPRNLPPWRVSWPSA